MSKSAIILPAYNEEKNIKLVIREARQALPNSFLLVIDDGSTDGTYEIAKSSGVTVLRHEENKGKGEAIKTGLNYLMKRRIDFFLIADTDRQYKIIDGKKILKVLEKGKADFVMGKRDWSKVPFRHKLGNLVWRASFNLLFGQKLEDTNCGFVGFSKRVAEKIRDSIHGGYILEDEMLISAIKNGLKVKQVPVDVVYRKRSGFLRGVRMVLGILIFILVEGIKYRFGV